MKNFDNKNGSMAQETDSVSTDRLEIEQAIHELDGKLTELEAVLNIGGAGNKGACAAARPAAGSE